MDQLPVLQSSRLILSKLEVSDIPRIIEFANNKNVAEPTLNIPHPYAEKDAIFWLNLANQGFKKKDQFTFAIRLKETREFIGGIGLILTAADEKASMGYWLAEPFWNRGFVTEAVGELLKFGFEELKLNKIYAVHLIENGASGKVMIKNGMIKEGEMLDVHKKDGKFRSLRQYRLLRKEYMARKI